MREKMSINGKWKYEDLTWNEVNQAVENKLIPMKKDINYMNKLINIF